MAEKKLAGLIGRPLDRVDGRLKVTGRATYAYEYAAQGAVTYGVIVPASIGKGRVVAVDVRDAQRAPGVLLVLTKDNAPPQTPWGPVDLPDRFARAEPALNTDEVRYFGFPVAFVVAETFEQATAAAALVRVRYAALPGDYDLHAAGPSRREPGPDQRRRGRRQCHRRFRICLRQCTSEDRGDLYYALPASGPDGAARDHGSVGGPDVDRPYLGAVDDKPAGRPRPNVQHPQGGCAHHYALCRGRVRQQAAILRRRDPRRDRCPHAGTTGQGGDDAAAALSHDHAPHRIRAAPAARRGSRRPADRLWPGCARRMCALRRLRRSGLLGRSHALRRSQPIDAPSPCKVRSAALRFHARPGRRDRTAGAGVRDGRAGRSPPPRSGRAAPAQRYPDRSGAEHGRLPRAILPRHCARVPPASAGTSAPQSRPASATGGRWSASASPARSVATYCRARPRVRVWKATGG